MSRSTVIFLLFFAGAFAFAQDSSPRITVFGGYSLLHTDNGGVSGSAIDPLFIVVPGTVKLRTDYRGWDAGVQYSFKPWLGIAGDVSSTFGASPFKVSSNSGIFGLPSAGSYTFLGGPVFTLRPASKGKPFVHALFGLNRTRISSASLIGTAISSLPSVTDSAFSMALGGGFDYRFSRRFGLRLGQVDYIYTGHDANAVGNALFGAGAFSGASTHQNNIRVSAGMTFYF